MLLNLVKDLYTQTNSQIRLGKKLSKSFRTRSGVRQGYILAPALFCRAMDWIMARAMDHTIWRSFLRCGLLQMM